MKKKKKIDIKKIIRKKMIFSILLVVVVGLFIVIELLNRGTYSTDDVKKNNSLTINCPETSLADEVIECSIVANINSVVGKGISVKYNIAEGIKFVEFTSEDWEIYLSDEEGFVLVNLDGVSGNVSVGKVKFTMPTDALTNEIYQIELTDITIGDGEDTILNLDNISEEIKIKSDINTFNDSLIIDEINSYIKYTKQKSTIKEFLTNINVVGNANIFISDTDGNEKSEDDLIVTGDKLTIYVGSEKVNEYLIAVRGDANGNGSITLTDLVQVRRHIAGWNNSETGTTSKKEGIYYNAIDMNNDGNVSLTDLVKIRRVIAGIDVDE